MIKVGIIGADTPDAGELLRILLHHPEVEIMTLYAPSWSGRRVESRHHGFMGEDIVDFTDKVNPDKLDILFLLDNSDEGLSIIQRLEEFPSLRIVDMSPERNERWEAYGFEYGLSEANRKPLVRGARMAIVPSHVASVALIALYPFAMHLLLSGDIELQVEAPVHIADRIDKTKVSREIGHFLSKTQSSFTGKVHITVEPRESGRTMKVTSVLRSPLAVPEVEKIYESVYDDHNFTFTTTEDVRRDEVEGTHRCIVTFKKPAAGLLEVSALADCHLRGGAGDAVHILNLFFSLDEKVGLNLKPSRYGEEDVSSSATVSWFA